MAQEKLAKQVMGVGYFPIDWWLFSRRAWSRIAPDLVVITEGERWPEHIHQASKRGTPVVCINARLSDRSFRRMKGFPPASHLMLRGITRLLAGSSQDAARFRELGFPAERLVTTGNIKLDVEIPRLDDAARDRLRRELGLPRGLVLVGSSTWPGEETTLVACLRAARLSGLACSLLIVPRHAERRAEIERELTGSGLRFHLRSLGASPGEVDVAVADTTGELRNLVQLGDLVFVGKSLAPHTEGQTPVEAAALEKPIVFGPGMGNFRAIARDLLERHAAIQVPDATALVPTVVDLLRDASRRASLAAAAHEWRRDNAGAVGRTRDAIMSELRR
jgi:3-deoxy-D-manno-octulosonic-acid transferase